MADLYLTYGIRERFWASGLAAALEAQGYSVFWDHAVTPGEHVRPESQKALDEAKCVLAIWSETSMDDHWVLQDSKQAAERGILYSVLTREGTVPKAFESADVSDLKDWSPSQSQDDRFTDFLKAISTVCPPSQPTAIDRERRTIERLERMRTETERKIKERERQEAKMIRRRMSV